MFGRTLLLLTCALACSAGKWPTPAGGASASGDPEVLFTFDDGPHEKHTTRILDALDEHGVKAIFFWTGQRVTSKAKGREQRLALVDRAVVAGHLVGNHTSTHAKLCTVSKTVAAAEIDNNAALFGKLTGLPMLLLRVPYGARCHRLDQMLAERSLSHMHWDLDPQEYRNRSEEYALTYLKRRLRRLKDGARAIVLMHDTQPVTAKAIPKILVWIAEENVRRSKAGKRPIRILSGSSWVAEHMPTPLLGWATSSIESGHDALTAALRKLVP